MLAGTSGSLPQARDGGILAATTAEAAEAKTTMDTLRPGCEREPIPIKRTRSDGESVVIAIGEKSAIDDEPGWDKPPLISIMPDGSRPVRISPIMIDETLGGLVSNARRVVPPATGVSAPRSTRVLPFSRRMVHRMIGRMEGMGVVSRGDPDSMPEVGLLDTHPCKLYDTFHSSSLLARKHFYNTPAG